MGIRRLPASASPSRSARSSSSSFVPQSKWSLQLSQSAAFKRQDSNAPTIFSDADGADDGAFSGWVYVAQLPHKKRKDGNKTRRMEKKIDFQLRYCRLDEIVCAIFVSERDACVGQELSQHVVIRVECVPERNKTFLITDYEDRQLLLHTTMENDFDEWLDAFSCAIRSTQVAKTTSGRLRNHTLPEAQSMWATDLRMRSFTEPPNFQRDPEDIHEPHRTTETVWLYLKNPWWRRKSYSRRYFVLIGRTLSCFSVNKEGQRAQFSDEVLGCRYHYGTDAEIFTRSGRTLHVRATERRVQDLSGFIEQIGIAVAHDL